QKVIIAMLQGLVGFVLELDRFIVARLENINGFLAVNTPPDDLIRIDFEQERVVPKVMLYIFKEFVLLLGRHPFHNKVPLMEENPPKQSPLGILLVKKWCNELEHRSLFCLHSVSVENALFLFPQDRTYEKSLASHISLKSRSQSGQLRLVLQSIFSLVYERLQYTLWRRITEYLSQEDGSSAGLSSKNLR
nr:hypothetical protein [Tanacetum cinerariifolium]